MAPRDALAIEPRQSAAQGSQRTCGHGRLPRCVFGGVRHPTGSSQAPITPVVAQPPPAVPTRSETSTKTSSKASKTVKASYQGSSTAGHSTASGEPYNPNGLTAASRTLPIGSTVKVTNPATGRSVKVRINDRGPFVHGRDLDLSKRAAEKVGITHKGVSRLKVTPVESHPTSSESEAPAPVATPGARN